MRCLVSSNTFSWGVSAPNTESKLHSRFWPFHCSAMVSSSGIWTASAGGRGGRQGARGTLLEHRDGKGVWGLAKQAGASVRQPSAVPLHPGAHLSARGPSPSAGWGARGSTPGSFPSCPPSATRGGRTGKGWAEVRPSGAGGTEACLRRQAGAGGADNSLMPPRPHRTWLKIFLRMMASSRYSASSSSSRLACGQPRGPGRVQHCVSASGSPVGTSCWPQGHAAPEFQHTPGQTQWK